MGWTELSDSRLAIINQNCVGGIQDITGQAIGRTAVDLFAKCKDDTFIICDSVGDPNGLLHAFNVARTNAKFTVEMENDHFSGSYM